MYYIYIYIYIYYVYIYICIYAYIYIYIYIYICIWIYASSLLTIVKHSCSKRAALTGVPRSRNHPLPWPYVAPCSGPRSAWHDLSCRRTMVNASYCNIFHYYQYSTTVQCNTGPSSRTETTARLSPGTNTHSALLLFGVGRRIYIYIYIYIYLYICVFMGLYCVQGSGFKSSRFFLVLCISKLSGEHENHGAVAS